ncbi:MAG TPA: heavy metal-responsive transcriptional regulator [Candidatus Acidoferrum sp.]|nr:heavy metal-responsive transcriptional regulator [Candidatus Acidoferrum sp.]
MRSGDLAQRTGISPDSIRHYERLGLLKAPPRTNGGYRDYPPESLDRVRLIRRALQVGFSLGELATILRVRDRGGVPCRGVFAAAKSKLKQVDSQIKELKAMRRKLQEILGDWSARIARAQKGQPAWLLENLPQNMEERDNAIRRNIRRNFRDLHGNRRAGSLPTTGRGRSGRTP